MFLLGEPPHVEDYIHPSGNGKKTSSVVRDNVSVVADLSIYCIMKILAKTNSYQQILYYREHEALCKRIQDYQVRLGFGLHVGWSIEGLIGSEFKIDASYLSPNVNLAA